MSKIEWTMQTWNPVVGCDKVSEGCKNCYAITMAHRLMHMPASKDKYAGTVEKTAGGKLNWTGKVNLDHSALQKPLNTKKPTTFFVNSMSDLFHEDVPFEFIMEVFFIMQKCPQHTFQILTKRPKRMVEWFTEWTPNPFGVPYEPLKNVWIGVSVENQKTADERIPLLQNVPAAVRFLSCEPLLGPVDIMKAVGCYLSPSRFSWNINREIHWVIAGGESGHGARPSHPDWFRQLRDQCKAANVPFFFKQWGEWCDITHAVQCIPEDRSLASFRFKECFIWKDGQVTNEANYRDIDNDLCTTTFKMGKHATGRLLDGVTHDEMPKIQEATNG